MEPIIFSPLIKMAFITKWKCYRGKIIAKIFWFKRCIFKCTEDN